MNAIKPTWVIAKQISRRHTIFSSLMTGSLMLVSFVVAWVVIKLLGYSEPYVYLKSLIKTYKPYISFSILFIHLVPVNWYAIVLTLRSPFKRFEVAIYSRQENAISVRTVRES